MSKAIAVNYFGMIDYVGYLSHEIFKLNFSTILKSCKINFHMWSDAYKPFLA